MNRRLFLLGLSGIVTPLCAPAIIRTAGLIMSVKSTTILAPYNKWFQQPVTWKVSHDYFSISTIDNRAGDPVAWDFDSVELNRTVTSVLPGLTKERLGRGELVVWDDSAGHRPGTLRRAADTDFSRGSLVGVVL